MVKRRQRNSSLLGVSIVVCGVVTAIAWGVTDPRVRAKLAGFLPAAKSETRMSESDGKIAAKKSSRQTGDKVEEEGNPFGEGDAAPGVASLEQTDEVPASRERLKDNVDNPFEADPAETRLVSNEVAASKGRKGAAADPFADFETGETADKNSSPPARQSPGVQAEELVETPRLADEETKTESPAETSRSGKRTAPPQAMEHDAGETRPTARTKESRISGEPRMTKQSQRAVPFEKQPVGDAEASRAEVSGAEASGAEASGAEVDEFEKPVEQPIRKAVRKPARKISRLNYEESSEPLELNLSHGEDSSRKADLNRMEEQALPIHQDAGEIPEGEGEEEGEGTLDLAVVRKMIANGQEAKGHRILSDWYWKFPENRALFQQDLDELAGQIYFSPQPHYEEPYLIQPGDRLSTIADEYQVSWRFLSKLNEVNPKKIRAGKKLKVFQGPFAASIDLSDFELTVHQNGLYVKKYKIGIGKRNSSPVGEFTVRDKLENPTYYGNDGNVVDADDPLNPLGERWIDLGDGIGIHGTLDPKSIGGTHSKGCIRMLNSDADEVYDLLTLGSSVKIQR